MFTFCELEQEFRDGSTYNQGWLLEIDSVEKLENWFATRNEALDIWEDLKREASGLRHFENEKSYAYQLIISKRFEDKCTISDFCNLYDEITLGSKLKLLEKYGKIYINQVGGFCTLGERTKVKNKIEFENMIYPEATKKDFKIVRFPNGTHYYIKSLGQAVHYEGKEKWDSREEARNVIQELLKKNTKQKSKEELFNE